MSVGSFLYQQTTHEITKSADVVCCANHILYEPHTWHRLPLLQIIHIGIEHITNLLPGRLLQSRDIALSGRSFLATVSSRPHYFLLLRPVALTFSPVAVSTRPVLLTKSQWERRDFDQQTDDPTRVKTCFAYSAISFRLISGYSVITVYCLRFTEVVVSVPTVNEHIRT